MGKKAGSQTQREEDAAVILRAVVDINQRGGRELLVQVLKGTSEPQLRRLGLENCPVFGIYETLATGQIEAKIDQTAALGYLEQVNSKRGSRIHLTPAGVEIARDTLAVELLAEFDEQLGMGKAIDFSEFSDTDVHTQMRLLELVAATGDWRYLDLLAAWEPFAPRKLRKQISFVHESLVRQDSAI